MEGFDSTHFQYQTTPKVPSVLWDCVKGEWSGYKGTWAHTSAPEQAADLRGPGANHILGGEVKNEVKLKSHFSVRPF